MRRKRMNYKTMSRPKILKASIPLILIGQIFHRLIRVEEVMIIRVMRNI
jgi:hypothetical protein